MRSGIASSVRPVMPPFFLPDAAGVAASTDTPEVVVSLPCSRAAFMAMRVASGGSRRSAVLARVVFGADCSIGNPAAASLGAVSLAVFFATVFFATAFFGATFLDGVFFGVMRLATETLLSRNMHRKSRAKPKNQKTWWGPNLQRKAKLTQTAA